MRREDLRCPDCNTVYLTLKADGDNITATHYSGHKIATSDGHGNATAHRVHRREHIIDVLQELRDGGLPIVSVECRCRVRQIDLYSEMRDLYRR